MWHGRAVTIALGVAIAAAFALSAEKSYAQTGYGPNDAPNPYKFDYGWAKLPDGRKWGAAVGVAMDRDGKSVWVFDRCETATDCSKSKVDPIMKFDSTGKMVKSFGGGMFNYPHGLHIDPDNNVWVTDGRALNNGKGHTVMKFSQDGKLLMTLGKPGVAGSTPDTFNSPSDILMAPNGDIFVADGHGGDSNNRIVKFTKDGKYIKEWGKKGTGPGEFDVPHRLAIDTAGGPSWGATVVDSRTRAEAEAEGSDPGWPVGFHPWRVSLQADVERFRAHAAALQVTPGEHGSEGGHLQQMLRAQRAVRPAGPSPARSALFPGTLPPYCQA